MSFKNITEIKRANKQAGQHWFSTSTMRFFESRAHPGVYGGRYFISSEQFIDSRGNADPRRYTIREAAPDGTVDTVGDFQGFPSLETAKAFAKELVDRKIS